MVVFATTTSTRTLVTVRQAGLVITVTRMWLSAMVTMIVTKMLYARILLARIHATVWKDMTIAPTALALLVMRDNVQTSMRGLRLEQQLVLCAVVLVRPLVPPVTSHARPAMLSLMVSARSLVIFKGSGQIIHRAMKSTSVLAIHVKMVARAPMKSMLTPAAVSMVGLEITVTLM